MIISVLVRGWTISQRLVCRAVGQDWRCNVANALAGDLWASSKTIHGHFVAALGVRSGRERRVAACKYYCNKNKYIIITN